ncbi:MAG: restriction endonuclease [Deltaproteobacteria bacterium]|nr:restriction endonuclease [Deltaproteobacteria bacterium]
MQLSENFEKQIKRIHDLIEQKGSEITWNDKIPDPDNLSQPRQIDITIKRENKLTLIECRIHKDRQDVQWIEELMGRRNSLRADSVIAVSASSFTKGAILKARKFGIILRDLISLTEEEITTWGHLTKVWLTYYQYENTFLGFKVNPQNDLTLDDLRTFLQTKNDFVFKVFNLLADKFEEVSPKGVSCGIRGELGINEEVSIKNYPILGIIFDTKIKPLQQHLSIPSVVAYDAPEIPLEDRNIFIEEVDFGNFQITKASGKVSLAVDLTPITPPPDCLFRLIDFDLGRVMNIKHVEFFGKPDLSINVPRLKVAILN